MDIARKDGYFLSIQPCENRIIGSEGGVPLRQSEPGRGSTAAARFSRSIRFVQSCVAVLFSKKHAGVWGKSSRASDAETIKHSRQVFTVARRRKLITDNPFETVKTGSQRNQERFYFVTIEDYLRLLDRF